MIPSTFFGLNRPIGIEDTMARRLGNLPSQCEDWQFGLTVIRVAELAHGFFGHSQQARRLRCGAAVTNAARAKMSHPAMMHRTTVLRHVSVRYP
jgi:hypothetical protein